MKMEELLNSEKVLLPITVDTDDDVRSKMKESLSNYVDIIKQVDELKDLVEILELIQRRLNEALDLYFDGRPSDAYNKIESIFNDNKEDNLLIGSFKDISYPGEYKQLYRARIGDFYSYDKCDMFHIPFNKRELIHTERYSIPGSPCLYLGGSAYVCWEELGRPDFNKLFISRFEVNTNFKILDLSYTVQDLNIANNGKPDDFKRKFFITWPIICACSIKVKDKAERKFKTEYVIPQLVLQAARNCGIDGLAYFSVNGNYSKQLCKPVFINYVFPAVYKDNGRISEKYSETLKNNFKLTTPLNYGLWNDLTPGGRKTLELTIRSLGDYNSEELDVNIYRTRSCVDIYKGVGPEYQETNLYQFETFLRRIKASDLD